MRRCAGSLLFFLAAAPGFAQTAPTTSAVGELTVQPVQHATLVLSHGETTIYVDPLGGAEAFADAAEPDLILLTDTHGDHLDAATIGAVAGEGTAIVAPQAVAERLGEGQRAKVLANGETTSAAAKKFRITPGRVSQIRRELEQAWHRFQGEPTMA